MTLRATKRWNRTEFDMFLSHLTCSRALHVLAGRKRGTVNLPYAVLAEFPERSAAFLLEVPYSKGEAGGRI